MAVAPDAEDHDARLKAIARRLDASLNEVRRNGPVSAERLQRDLDALWDRKAREAQERAENAVVTDR